MPVNVGSVAVISGGLGQFGKLRGGNEKIDRNGQSNALIWSCLQPLNKTPFLDGSRSKASPYNHQVKGKM